MSDYRTVMYIDDDKVIHGALQSKLGTAQFMAVDRLFDRIGRGTIKSIAVNNTTAHKRIYATGSFDRICHGDEVDPELGRGLTKPVMHFTLPGDEFLLSPWDMKPSASICMLRAMAEKYVDAEPVNPIFSTNLCLEQYPSEFHQAVLNDAEARLRQGQLINLDMPAHIKDTISKLLH